MNVRRWLVNSVRVVLGLVFVVFGLNGFFHFLPQPPMPAAAGAFLGGLAAAGYMFPLIKGVEVLAGALLLSNRFVPLALTLLAPIVVNIVAFHTALAPPNPVTAIVLGGELFLAWTYRSAFAGMLRSRVEPTIEPKVEPAVMATAG
ncbi:MAG: DoxX family protein [Myxococcales bacterium]|nr:DoxX family protein [Myxococcales bacterium]